jgi:hypothetical protein
MKSRVNPNLVPGWKMTFKQRASYWRMWSEIAEVWNQPRGADLKSGISNLKSERSEGWTAAEAKSERLRWHTLAGLGPVSATAINHTTDFDELKKVHLAITDPDNVGAQMAMVKMPRTRLIESIKRHAPEGFWRHISFDRFKTYDLGELDETQLTQLRNTVQARMEKKIRDGESDQSSVTYDQPVEEPF